jgi:hypothetical protein
LLPKRVVKLGTGGNCSSTFREEQTGKTEQYFSCQYIRVTGFGMQNKMKGDYFCFVRGEREMQ